MVSLARVPCPGWFRYYLLEGDHWRAGRRVRGEIAKFNDLQLHRGDGEFTATFEDFLEQGLIDDRVERAVKTAAANYRRVVQAIRTIEKERPKDPEMDALHFYMVPKLRRGRSAVQAAEALRLSVDGLRDAADRGVLMVWDELGGVWLGEQGRGRAV